MRIGRGEALPLRYIARWLSVLKNDRRAIFTAATYRRLPPPAAAAWPGDLMAGFIRPSTVDLVHLVPGRQAGHPRLDHRSSHNGVGQLPNFFM